MALKLEPGQTTANTRPVDYRRARHTCLNVPNIRWYWLLLTSILKKLNKYPRQ